MRTPTPTEFAIIAVVFVYAVGGFILSFILTFPESEEKMLRPLDRKARRKIWRLGWRYWNRESYFPPDYKKPSILEKIQMILKIIRA